MRKVYCEMFLFLCKEGKKRTVAQKGILNCDVRLAALSSLALDAQILAPKDCMQSKEYEDKVFTLNEIEKSKILPIMSCKRNGGCVCCYVFIEKGTN